MRNAKNRSAPVTKRNIKKPMHRETVSLVQNNLRRILLHSAKEMIKIPDVTGHVVNFFAKPCLFKE